MPKTVRSKAKELEQDIKKAEKVIFHRAASDLEIFVDKLVPYVLLFVLVVFVGGFVFPEFFHPYEQTIFYLDIILVTGILGLDLSFKYSHAKKHEGFLRKHWIEVLAIFPFFLFFRVFEEVMLLSRLAPVKATIKETQIITH